MLIRYKLLLLLLGIALIPLIIVSWRGYHATRDLGSELATESRKFLTERTTQQLRQAIANNTTILDRTKDLLENALRLQAKEAESRLEHTPAYPEPVYFAEQFETNDTPPPGLRLSQKFMRRGTDGNLSPMMISEEAQNFLLAPGVSRQDVADDITKLSTMVDAYQQLYRRHGELVLWVYTALDSGVHTAFPGKGHYPKGYDPRIRPWYTSARDSGDIVWSAATVDAVTRGTLMTVSMPIRHPDGRFAGVTAIDIPVLKMLENARLRATPSKQSKTFVVDYVRRHTTGAAGGKNGTQDYKFGLKVFARQDIQSKSWDTVTDLGWLESKDTKPFQAVHADMKAGKSGIRRMSFQGKDSIWAYGRFATPFSFLLVIVPYDDITKQARQTERFVRTQTRRQLQIAGWVSAGIIILVLFLAFYSSRTITRPVQHLAEAAKRLAEGDFKARARVTTNDEIGALAKSFNEAVPQLEDRVKVRQALDLAMDVQQHLLPKEAPQLEGYEIAGKSVYCDETGGDYYDFIDLTDLGSERVGVAVGDVSGHGFAAALLMTTVRALLRSRATLCGTLRELMNDINQHLSKDTHGGRFMTLFYLILDREAPALRWVSAGHDPALVFDCASGTFSELAGNGIPLGIEDAWDYEERTQDELNAGSIIVIGTDGIWETRNPDGAQFGKEALKDLIQSLADQPAAEICNTVHDMLVAYRGNVHQADDITLVVIKKDPGECVT